jgi:hypothetical protein
MLVGATQADELEMLMVEEERVVDETGVGVGEGEVVELLEGGDEELEEAGELDEDEELDEADEEEDDNDDEMLAEEAVDEAELRVVEELDEEEELDDEEDETDAAVELRDDKVLEALEDDDVRVEDVVDCTLELAEIVEEVVVDLELDCDEETSLSHLPNPP